MEEDLKNIEEFLSKRTLDEIDKFLFNKYIKSMEKVLDAYRQDEKMIKLIAEEIKEQWNVELNVEYFRKRVENNG